MGMVSSVGLGFGGGMRDVRRGEARRGWTGWAASRLKPGGLPPARPLLPRRGSQRPAVAGVGPSPPTPFRPCRGRTCSARQRASLL